MISRDMAEMHLGSLICIHALEFGHTGLTACNLGIISGVRCTG
jgi:hypothetical protein